MTFAVGAALAAGVILVGYTLSGVLALVDIFRGRL